MDASWQSYGLDVSLQSVSFSGRPFDYRTGFFVRSFDGHLSGGQVAYRNVTTRRRRGVLSVPGSRDSPRRFVLSGFAWAQHPGMLENLGVQLGSILADETSQGVLSWSDLGVHRRAAVFRESATFVRRGSSAFADWSLTLRAPDQAILGDALQPAKDTPVWGQSVRMVNRGTHAARVTASVRGSRAGYTIAGPGGARAVITAALTPGALHLYDGDTGALYIGGAVQDTGVSVSDVLELPHGVHEFTVSAGAEISIAGHDTYIP